MCEVTSLPLGLATRPWDCADGFARDAESFLRPDEQIEVDTDVDLGHDGLNPPASLSFRSIYFSRKLHTDLQPDATGS